MAIRMLTAWGGHSTGDIVSLSGAEETRLVGLGLATTDLDGDVGNGIPVTSNTNPVSGAVVKSIWVGTQAQYDAIATKDINTEYNIVEA